MLFEHANKNKKQIEKLDGENKILKESINKFNAEEGKRKRALAETNKIIKTKDKEIYNLQNRLDNFFSTNKGLKENISSLKREKNNLEIYLNL